MPSRARARRTVGSWRTRPRHGPRLEYRVLQVLVVAIEMKQRDRPVVETGVDLAGFPARLRLVDEVDVARHPERGRLLVERLEERGDELGLDDHVVVEEDDGRVPRLCDAAVRGAGEALVLRERATP